jgi:hypothetical protein
MAETILNSALTVQRWRRDYFKDYVRASRFRPYMGRGKDNIIITMYELQSEAGKTINVPFISALNGAGVSGSQVLEGNEEELVTANMPISVDWRRNGVVVPKSESYKTEIDLLDAARDELRRWEANLLRADIIREFGAVTTAAGVSIPYASATEPEKDAWLALNADRIIFGKDVSNNSANDHSASLANIDTTNDKATAALLTKVKRRMKAAKITPYMTTDGREYFVWFVGSRAFRDLSEDASILAANRDARERNVDTNPIFQGGDLIYQGVIIREEEEIPASALRPRTWSRPTWPALAPSALRGAKSRPRRPTATATTGSVQAWRSRNSWGSKRSTRTAFKEGCTPPMSVRVRTANLR